MFANEKPLNRFEVSAMISICGLLFIVAFKDLGHLSWAIPAMTLFSLAGIGLLCGLISAPAARELAVSSGTER
jgi:hypothetical protein